MSMQKIIAIALIVLGTLALTYGGFSYISDRHVADIGPLHMQVNEHRYVNIPVGLGISLLVIGGLILLVPRKTAGAA